MRAEQLKAAQRLCLGIFVLSLSLIVWRATENVPGWLALFIPGAIYIVRGFVETFAA